MSFYLFSVNFRLLYISMEGISQGNFVSISGGRQGWVIGHFIDEDILRRTDAVEVKWGIHLSGDSNAQYTANRSASTLSILIRGRFRLLFRVGMQVEEVLLKNEGDYALWLPGVYHNWIAEGEGNTVILTVRWPSTSGDQVEMQP